MRVRVAVAKNTWHNRVYRHWADEIADNPPATVNLCHYMRAVLIYVPFIYLAFGLSLCLAYVIAVALSPVWIPLAALYFKSGRFHAFVERVIGWLGRFSPFLVLFVVGAGIAAAAIALSLDVWWYGLALIGGSLGGLALLFAIVAFFLWRSERRKEQPATKTQGTASLGWSWIKAKKERICPLIETVE